MAGTFLKVDFVFIEVWMEAAMTWAAFVMICRNAMLVVVVVVVVVIIEAEACSEIIAEFSKAKEDRIYGLNWI